MINKELIRKVFTEYTDDYDSSDEKILLKIRHTFRVAAITDEITTDLGLSAEDADLAWCIGMLHDIGRFEQVRRYQTFNDAKSVDHAEFGADLLFKDGLIERFFPSGTDNTSEDSSPVETENFGEGTSPAESFASDGNHIAPEALAMIELAIRQHNKYRLCEGLTERQTMFCNIIRDADKIDILRVNLETPMEVIYNVTVEELRESAITPEVLQCFNEEHCVLRSLKRTPIDNLVGHSCLPFELVYPVSRRIVDRQGWIYRMLDYESAHPVTRQQLADMKQKMTDWLKSSHFSQ